MSIQNNLKQQRQEVYSHIAGYDIDAIGKAKVMVVGAGALGNEVLKNLALLNIGHILIVDFDVIEASNLSRSVLFRESDCDGQTPKSFTAARRIKEINPNVKIKVIDGDIAANVGLGVFKRMDAIVGCLDNMLARLSINRSVYKVGKAWIDGGLSDTAGVVAAYQSDHSCYECNLSKEDLTVIKERFSCPDKIRRYGSRGRMPTTPINASIIAALQVQEVMNQINKLDGFSIIGKSVKFFGGFNEIVQMELNKKHKGLCLSDHHFKIDETIDTSHLREDMSLGQLLDWAEKEFKAKDVTLMLNNEIATSLMSEKTGKFFSIFEPRLGLTDALVSKYKQSTEDVMIVKDSLYELDRGFKNMDITLTALGIPPLDILQLLVDGEDKYVELSGDEDFLDFQ